jgi:hypothetical protein
MYIAVFLILVSASRILSTHTRKPPSCRKIGTIVVMNTPQACTTMLLYCTVMCCDVLCRACSAAVLRVRPCMNAELALPVPRAEQMHCDATLPATVPLR